MKNQGDQHNPQNRQPRFFLFAAATVIVTALFVIFVHPFLAINEPLPADVLVVEGWVPEYVLVEAVKEFQRGGYTRVFTSGLEFPPRDPAISEGSYAARSARRLVALGLSPAAVEACPTPARGWNRTSSMARAVCDRVRQSHLPARGMNVITLGPHARQSRLAFQRMLGTEVPVGVISVPKDDYIAARWWASAAGRQKTLKDFAGWFWEVTLGARS